MTSTSQPSKKSHKRKSVGGDLATLSAPVQVNVEQASSSAGPAFVNFPSIRPSKSTPFTIYSRDVGSTSDLTRQQTIIAGETDDVEFFSTNRDYQLNTEGADCQYLPAIYDPSTSTVHIHPSAPLYLLTHRVKRLRSSVTAPKPIDAKEHWKVKRNDLGETFGTRKAKTQIKAEERNKVDVAAMESIRGHLMETIPDVKVEAEATEASELIPTPNLTTSDPTEVYPRDSLLTPAEWSSIDVSHLLAEQDDKARTGLLPYRRSYWLSSKMRVIIHLDNKAARRTQMKYLYYLSTLLAFQSFASQLHRTPASELSSKFPGVHPQLLNGIVNRFSESQGKKRSVTEKMGKKLLMWILTLYLILDNYAVEVQKVAADLKMDTAKISDMYKNLGCSVNLATPAEREKQGLTLAQASAAKKAVLVAPVTFPKIKRRGPAKR
ncbi:hypothetical protein I316_06922 [Kwoniella heveanensis BCC8398]|uniref:DNA-directed RNA polymerase I subunit RPA49 n=1 Tax=Kwoniella heveanensis BCC8398 TaxID=1296120 RepID=A0A1B9GKE0_9TREE|nr:hypothetical protein I316_06922 [Kwoniella heveanensis BCC8398]